MKSRTAWGIGAAASMVLVIALHRALPETGANASVEKPNQPPVILATRQDLSSYVTASGVLQYRSIHHMYSQTDAVVKELHVKVGDDVRSGDILLEFDAGRVRRDEDKAGAQMQALQGERDLLIRERALQKQKADREATELTDALRAATEDAEQAQQAFERGMISDADRRKSGAKVEELIRRRELATAAAEHADRRLAAEEQKLDMRRRELRGVHEDVSAGLNGTRVTSPRDGRVLNVTEKLLAGNPTGSGVPFRAGELIVSVAELGRYAIRLSLSERDVLRIRQGSEVRFVQKSSGASGKGVVRSVVGTAEGAIGGVVAFNGDIDVTEIDGEIVVAGRVECRIHVAERRNVVVIPVDAVGIDREGTFAQVIERAGPVRRQLRLGVDDGKSVEVVTGLSEGEQLLRLLSGSAGRKPGK